MNKVSFPSKSDFEQILRQRVEQFFKDNNLKQTGDFGLHLKAIFTFLGILTVYYFLVFQTSSMWTAIGLVFLLVQLKILLAFNVMHDGGHYSFSSKKWINDLAVRSMEFLGSSSFLWRQKHNTLHHTYTNVDGKDDDLVIGSMMRLCPTQKHYVWQKYQHIYGPILYGFLSLYLLVYSDFQKFISNKIGDTPLQKYSKKDLLVFILSKLFYVSYTLIIPMMFHSIWSVLGLFLFGHVIFGLTLSVVFQLAHTVTITEFPQSQEDGQMPYSWMEHQLRTTTNFAMKNPIVTFYCGGLNYQVEHHLFHRISHVHYPKISPIVKQTCEEFGKPYHYAPSFWSALKSHFSFLKQMGTA